MVGLTAGFRCVHADRSESVSFRSCCVSPDDSRVGRPRPLRPEFGPFPVGHSFASSVAVATRSVS